jgi:hypothetical protein
MRITRKHLEAKVSTVNSMLGHPEPQWNTVGSIWLYSANDAGTKVHRIVNTSGGVNDIMPLLGTNREVNEFLRGMIAALSIARGEQ